MTLSVVQNYLLMMDTKDTQLLVISENYTYRLICGDLGSRFHRLRPKTKLWFISILLNPSRLYNIGRIRIRFSILTTGTSSIQSSTASEFPAFDMGYRRKLSLIERDIGQHFYEMLFACFLRVVRYHPRISIPATHPSDKPNWNPWYRVSDIGPAIYSQLNDTAKQTITQDVITRFLRTDLLDSERFRTYNGCFGQVEFICAVHSPFKGVTQESDQEKGKGLIDESRKGKDQGVADNINTKGGGRSELQNQIGFGLMDKDKDMGPKGQGGFGSGAGFIPQGKGNGGFKKCNPGVDFIPQGKGDDHKNNSEKNVDEDQVDPDDPPREQFTKVDCPESYTTLTIGDQSAMTTAPDDTTQVAQLPNRSKDESGRRSDSKAEGAGNLSNGEPKINEELSAVKPASTTPIEVSHEGGPGSTVPIPRRGSLVDRIVTSSDKSVSNTAILGSDNQIINSESNEKTPSREPVVQTDGIDVENHRFTWDEWTEQMNTKGYVIAMMPPGAMPTSVPVNPAVHLPSTEPAKGCARPLPTHNDPVCTRWVSRSVMHANMRKGPPILTVEPVQIDPFSYTPPSSIYQFDGFLPYHTGPYISDYKYLPVQVGPVGQDYENTTSEEVEAGGGTANEQTVVIQSAGPTSPNALLCTAADSSSDESGSDTKEDSESQSEPECDGNFPNKDGYYDEQEDYFRPEDDFHRWDRTDSLTDQLNEEAFNAAYDRERTDDEERRYATRELDGCAGEGGYSTGQDSSDPDDQDPEPLKTIHEEGAHNAEQ